MELKHYLRVVLRRWKTVLLVAAAAVAFTVYFVSGQTAKYESTGSYVVRPRELESGEVVRATDALNRGAEINSTYSRIARSEVVEDRAKAELSAQGLSTGGLRVQSEVVPGTNIIEIGATGGDPSIVTTYATEIGSQTIGYLDETDDLFQLQLLDAPEEPDGPIPSKARLTLVVGAVFGLLAGATVAFGAEYLSEGTDRRRDDIYDDTTGAYSREFLRLRFRQEMSRCELPSTTRARWKVRSHSFTFGVVKVSKGSSGNGSGPAPKPSELRDVAQGLIPNLRPEDVLGYLGDDTFGLMLPDMPVGPAQKLLVEWSRSLDDAGLGARNGSGLRATVAVCDCRAEGLSGDDESVRHAEMMRADGR